MKKSYIIGAVLVAGLVGTASVMTYKLTSNTTKAAPGKVVEIQSLEDFDAQLKNNNVVAVKYYAPWCGFCKKMAPVYDKLATQYPNARLVKVDFTKEHGKKLAQKAGVGGFPTFHLYENGTKVDEVVGANEAGLREKLSARAA